MLSIYFFRDLQGVSWDSVPPLHVLDNCHSGTAQMVSALPHQLLCLENLGNLLSALGHGEIEIFITVIRTESPWIREVLLLLVVYLKSLGSKIEPRENSQVVRVLKQENHSTNSTIRMQALRLSRSALGLGSNLLLASVVLVADRLWWAWLCLSVLWLLGQLYTSLFAFRLSKSNGSWVCIQWAPSSIRNRFNKVAFMIVSKQRSNNPLLLFIKNIHEVPLIPWG